MNDKSVKRSANAKINTARMGDTGDCVFLRLPVEAIGGFTLLGLSPGIMMFVMELTHRGIKPVNDSDLPFGLTTRNYTRYRTILRNLVDHWGNPLCKIDRNVHTNKLTGEYAGSSNTYNFSGLWEYAVYKYYESRGIDRHYTPKYGAVSPIERLLPSDIPDTLWDSSESVV